MKDHIACFDNLLKTSKELGFRVSSDLGSFTSQVILYFITLRGRREGRREEEKKEGRKRQEVERERKVGEGKEGGRWRRGSKMEGEKK